MGLFDRLKKSLFGNKSTEEESQTSDELKDSNDLDSSQEQEKVDSKENKKIENNLTGSEEKKAVNQNESEFTSDINQSVDTQNNIHESEQLSKIDTVDSDFNKKTKETFDKENVNDESSSKADSKDVAITETNDSNGKYDLGLKKSRNSFATKFNHFLANFRSVDQEFFDNLEDFLIESDVGYELAMNLSDQLKEMVKEENLKTKKEIGQAIIAYLINSYDVDNAAKNLNYHEGLNIYLFVGVNGAGKTTTIGKLANRFIKRGKKVILVAGDTFRAGATEQLDLWAQKTGAQIIKGKSNQDPASLVYEGIHQAKIENADYLMIDTAGRLQNKVNLMNELDKIKRTIKKESGIDPTETLLVIDATTGQNGLNQAKEFNQVTKLTGLVLSKLDGTAKGGIVLQIKKSLNIPVKLVGLGEKVDDLVDFDPEEFMRGFFKGILEIS